MAEMLQPMDDGDGTAWGSAASVVEEATSGAGEAASLVGGAATIFDL